MAAHDLSSACASGSHSDFKEGLQRENNITPEEVYLPNRFNTAMLMVNTPVSMVGLGIG